MPDSLQTRLFLALAALLSAMLLLFAGLSRLALQQGLGQYVAEIEIERMGWLSNRLLQRYSQNENWDFLRTGDTWRELVRLEEDQGRALGLAPPGGPRGNPPPPQRPGASGRSDVPDVHDARRDHPAPGRPPSPPPRMAEPAALPAGGIPAEPRHEPPDTISHRLALFDTDGRWLAGAELDTERAVRKPINYQGKTVAQLALVPADGIRTQADRAFVRRQLGFLLATGLVGLAGALLLSWLIGRRWLRPVRWLTEGAQQMAAGRLDARVPEQGRDELAALSRAFNHMARELERIESSREQWLGDIAHELRTPLAAMRAEIEALQDGVHQYNSASGGRLHRQIMRLSRLVDDLRLSLGAAGASGPVEAVEPVLLLQQAAEDMRERCAQAQLRLHMESLQALRESQTLLLQCDPLRLQQVFHNLLENSLRYTDAGGQIMLQAHWHATAQCLQLDISDSAPGVAPEHLPMLFERFYCPDTSRSRSHGGSGLGLSICRAIVTGLGGRIEAAPSALGGLTIRIFLPMGDAPPRGPDGRPASPRKN